MNSLYNILAIFLGGGIGATLRYITTQFCKNLFGATFWGTTVVNMTGCFLIGIVFGVIIQKNELLTQTTRLFIIVGFLGGLTTFSTFSLEIFEFIKNGKIFTALCYVSFTCIIALILTTIGFLLSKYL